MKKIFPIVILIVIIGAVGFFISRPKTAINTEQKKLDKLTVQAGWLLNGEFANVCSAIVNDYYKDEGLEVELVPGGPTGGSFIIATNAVAQNPDLDIAIDGDIVPLLRGVTKESPTEQLKMKAFAAFWNENPYGFIVKKDSGITSLKDLALKIKPDGTKYKIGVTADSVIQNAIASYANVSVKDLNLETVGFDASAFLSGQVDALASYWTTQAYEVEKAGIEYKFLNASELPGFNQPSMVALASDKTLQDKHDQLVKWLKATIKGSQFVVSNPAKAAEMITDNRCGGSNFDVTQEKWLIEKSTPLFDKNKIGWVYDNQITGFADAYYKLGQIPRNPSVDELLDYSVLNSIYK